MAHKLGLHRRLVREALSGAVPRQRPPRPRPTLGPVAEFIEAILEADRRAPRKQRHTAHRIWVRIAREQPGHRIAESTVREYVRERKHALGLRASLELWVRQQYALGEEAQVDWYEAEADLDGERHKLQGFALRTGVCAGVELLPFPWHRPVGVHRFRSDRICCPGHLDRTRLLRDVSSRPC